MIIFIFFKKMTRQISGALLVLILCFGYMHNANAAIRSCTSGSGKYAPEIDVTPINDIVYAGNELPVGTNIYHLIVSTVKNPGVKCTGSFSLPYYFQISSEKNGPPFMFNGKWVYPTNVPGVGVALWFSGDGPTRYFTTTPSRLSDPLELDSSGSSGRHTSIDVTLVKTGDIPSGAQINASTFPELSAYAGTAPGFTGLPIAVWTVNFAGAIHVTTSTCQTPDVNVALGSHEKSKEFTGKGSVTSWVNSSIILQGCPKFSGYFKGGNAPETSGGSIPSGGVREQNQLNVSLVPNSGIIDGTSGIIGVNGVGSSGNAATGVGIQIGYGSTSNPVTMWNFNESTKTITPPNTGINTITIPLSARYIQTGSTVTPGPANAQVTFIISYQ